MIMKLELNVQNKITSFGSLVIRLLRYSFSIINWRLEEIKEIDRKTRKIQRMYKMHHPKNNIDRLYVKKKKEGRGQLQTEVAYTAEDNSYFRIS